MKNIAIAIFVVFIVVTLGLYLVSFQVRETESCLVTTFGEPTRQISEPGKLPYFKLPFPIQQVHKFDSRMRVFAPKLEETATAGGEPIIVNTYVVWRIAEPLDFFNAVKTIRRAEDKVLLSHIRNTQKSVIGNHHFSEFVNSDEERIKFDQIEDEMLANLQQALVDANYGIEVKALGIKQLKIPEEVSKEVFERMKAERQRRSAAIVLQGTVAANRIKIDAELKSKELIAAAEARAKKIRGEGDAAAAGYLKMLDDAPELAMFLRDLEALQKIFTEGTTLVVPTDKKPFDLLKGIPDIKAGGSNK